MLVMIKKISSKEEFAVDDPIIAQLPAKHHSIIADNMDYYAQLFVDYVQWKSVRIHLINLCGRKHINLNIL